MASFVTCTVENGVAVCRSVMIVVSVTPPMTGTSLVPVSVMVSVLVLVAPCWSVTV